MNYKNELKTIKSLVSDSTWDILVACNAVIAGGAITSLFCNREVNDLDIYLPTEKDFFEFVTMVYEGNFDLVL